MVNEIISAFCHPFDDVLDNKDADSEYPTSSKSDTNRGFVLLPQYATHPVARLDVFDFITEPVLPASGHETGRYPPFAPGRISVTRAGNSGLIVDRAPGAMQGWFRTPHDSRSGRWWSLTMPMTDAKMQELNRLRTEAETANRVLVPDETGTVQWDPWVGEGKSLARVG
eukprot:2236522-Prymnesium_polylepis.1